MTFSLPQGILLAMCARGTATTKANDPATVRTVEVERKFDPPAEFALDDLDLVELPGVELVGEPVVHQLEALYFDTPALTLWANRWILRRRTGGDDAGWHIKRPSAGERSEHRFAFRSEAAAAAVRPPVDVMREVTVHVRGRQLAPIVRLRTERHIVPLRAADETLLAEVMFDKVVATIFDADGLEHPSRTWSEIETEVYSASDGESDKAHKALLAALSQRVLDAGATPSAHVSKLGAALGDRTAGVAVVEPPVTKHDLTAVVISAIADDVRRLTDHDPGVRTDEHDAVHQMRVSGRRLRSLLATYRPLFDGPTVDHLRNEIRWLGTELSRTRDVEVVREELLELVEAEPRPLRRGPVVRRVRTELDRQYRQAHAQAVQTLNEPRYFALLDALEEFVVSPPRGEISVPKRPKAQRVLLAQLTRRADRRVRRRAATFAALVDAPAAEREAALHDIRKAAKRARYAAEMVSGVFGEPAAAYAERMAKLQKVLGAYQDTVVIRQELLLVAEAARRAGEDTFTYGRLHALAEARATHELSRVAGVWGEASQPAGRAWMSGRH